MKEEYFTAENLQSVSRAMRDKADRSDGDLSVFMPGKSALIVIDMQRYFLDPASHAYIPSAPAIVPGLVSLTAQYRDKALGVVLTRHLNTADDAGMLGNWWADVIRRDDPLSEIDKSITSEGAVIIEKTQYDAFYNTNLDKLLRSKGISQVVIGGVMTHLCCETTARSAFVRGYEVFFLVDGTATYSDTFHEATLVNLGHGFATLVTVDEVTERLNHAE